MKKYSHLLGASLAFALATLLHATACAAPVQRAAEAAGANDPCALLTKEDAAGVLGKGLKAWPGEPTTAGGRTERRCRYTTETGFLEITVASPVTASEFEHAKTELKTVSGQTVRPLPGVDIPAFLRAGKGSATAYLLKGEVGVWIDRLDRAKVQPGASADESFEALSKDLKSVATKVAARMASAPAAKE